MHTIYLPAATLTYPDCGAGCNAQYQLYTHSTSTSALLQTCMSRKGVQVAGISMLLKRRQPPRSFQNTARGTAISRGMLPSPAWASASTERTSALPP